MNQCFYTHLWKSWTRNILQKSSRGPEQNGSTVVPQDINRLKHDALMKTNMKKLCDLSSKTIEKKNNKLHIFFYMCSTWAWSKAFLLTSYNLKGQMAITSAY